MRKREWTTKGTTRESTRSEDGSSILTPILHNRLHPFQVASNVRPCRGPWDPAQPRPARVERYSRLFGTRHIGARRRRSFKGPWVLPAIRPNVPGPHRSQHRSHFHGPAAHHGTVPQRRLARSRVLGRAPAAPTKLHNHSHEARTAPRTQHPAFSTLPQPPHRASSTRNNRVARDSVEWSRSRAS